MCRGLVHGYTLVSTHYLIFLKQCSPNSRAKFVQFETVYRPEQMPGQNTPTLNWPYKEAVTINEAFHPLSLLCLGMYGKFFQIKMVRQLE